MSTDINPSERNESLRFYLKEELIEAGTRLDLLRKKMEAQNARGFRNWLKRLWAKIDPDDFNSLEQEYKNKIQRVQELPDGDVRLFLLRREIGTLKEDIAALGGNQKWHIPTRAWILIAVVLFLLYFGTLAILQGQNQGGISASATMTASAMPTQVPSPTSAPTSLPTVTP